MTQQPFVNRLPAEVAKARIIVQQQAAKARHDIGDFFSFVMKSEDNQARMHAAPHQRLMLDFAMQHDRAVLMIPADHAKTTSMAGLTLFLLGHEPTLRGAIISATTGQASKPLAMVRDYIEGSKTLRAVFADLRPSSRISDPWTGSAITVERPHGIRDASLMAVGIDGAITGARLKWCIVDDILNRENTATQSQRRKTYDWFDSSVLSRMVPVGGKVVVTNTAWHPDDLPHMLEKQGWPTLRMDIMGNIIIRNTDWDSDLIRPAHPTWGEECRLVSYDPDPENASSLWPARYGVKEIERLRKEHLPYRFNQLYMNLTRDDDTARCKIDWIEGCKFKARERGIFSMISNYEGPYPTFTGVDLAVQQGDENDDCAFFTFVQLPDGHRQLLDLDIGQYDGPTIVQKLFSISERFNSIIRVENNACFKPDALVLTYDGYKSIEDVKVGDLVWTHQARWRPVTATRSGTARLMAKAKGRGNVALDATPNHWFWMREAGRVPGRKGGQHRPQGLPTWVSVGFPEKSAYTAIAIPTWPKTKARVFGMGDVCDQDLPMLLGLYLAEGHTTRGQVVFTFNRTEMHLAEFVERVLFRYTARSITRSVGSGTLRVVISDTRLAKVFKCMGKSVDKAPPKAWFGWPSAVRLDMVRGWLLGDGCIRTNNKRTKWPQQFVSAPSISRDLILFMRSTLLEAGYRPALTANPPHTSEINGRVIKGKRSWTLSLPAEDTRRLLINKTSVEMSHWPTMNDSDRKSNASIVLDGDHAWCRLTTPPGGPFEKYDGPVHNLSVEEDESYTVDDYIVHNAQDFIRQFALARNISLPIKPHTTGRGKAHPEHGVEGLFIELSNKAWLIPNDKFGRCHPHVQRWIDECLQYTPSTHTGDALMASYFAREQARKVGLQAGQVRDDNQNGGRQPSLGMTIMAR